MAFRTNKVPAIEERTVSGSSVSFNSAFALPLKACKVSFSATRAGSGDPSPSNPRAISGVSAIGLTANSTPVSVNFDDTYYGGELDVVNKKAIIDRSFIVFDGSEDEQWGNYPNGFFIRISDIPLDADNSKGLSNMLKVGVDSTKTGISFGKSVAATYFFHITDNSTLFPTVTDRDTWRAFLNNNNLQLVYPLATPIEIDLSSIPDLSTILGNNTFSTDTGTLEITFADLQEKSASGSVATFNTALAMPLASCNIAVNAWQEGSGEPSPDNVRPIHGFSEVNVTRAGKNLFPFGEWYIPYDVNNFNLIVGNNSIFLKSGTYRLSFEYKRIDAPSINSFWRLYSSHVTSVDTTKQVQYGSLSLASESEWTSKSISVSISQNGWFGLDDAQLKGGISYRNIQLEVDSTATAYEPYITPTIYTIQLGQEVYGAEVDVVNGVAHVTHNIVDLGSLSWQYDAFGTNMLFYATISDIKLNGDVLSDIYERTVASVSAATFLNYKFRQYGANKLLFIRNDDYTDTAIFQTDMNGHKCVYELNTPFDIQLTPTQIETIIGNNTIFADTGDIDLTYKDLDIAKRGNFREVFKLPS